MTDPVTDLVVRQGFAVLDGAMATELERRGADLSGGLWSARVLADDPQLVGDVHRAYAAAGADIATTATYQASLEGFARHGIPESEVRRLVGLAYALARAATPDGIVATSVGPYGAVLADGSEYRGDDGMSQTQLTRFHAQRLPILAEPGIEVFACETIPSLVEARALAAALREVPEVPAWITFSARDGSAISDGTPIAECARYLDELDQVVAIGVNCMATEFATSLIHEIAANTDKSVVVYPNSGERWDPVGRRWSGRADGASFGSLAEQWYDAGARVIGGCCRTGPADIASLVEGLDAAINPS